MNLFEFAIADSTDVLSQLIAPTPSATQWREQLLRDAVPGFLAQQRWYGAKGQQIERIQFDQLHCWTAEDQTWLLAILEVRLEQGVTHAYFLPLAFVWEDAAMAVAPSMVLAKINMNARMGLLYDALAAPAFSRALVSAIGAQTAIPFGNGQLRGIPTSAYPQLRGTAALTDVKAPKVSGSNTALILDEQLFLKIYRRLHIGMNPEVEIGRFLTDASPYAHIVPVAGYLQYSDANRAMACAVLQGSVTHQGDAWHATLDQLEQYLEHALAAPLTNTANAAHLRSAVLLGQRTAELHGALCKTTGDSAFDPEPVSRNDITSWKAQVREDAEQTFALLSRKAASLVGPTRQLAAQLLAQRAALIEPILKAVPDNLQALKSRYHGDFHLGQVLISNGDFLLIDFEGEPARSLEERRAKHCPLRDVAGMVRSYSYAAAVALEHCTQRHPEQQAQLVSQAKTWELQTVSAFLAGYNKASASMNFLPLDSLQVQTLIALFCLEKALYELRYELDNRPNWVSVPISGLIQLLK